MEAPKSPIRPPVALRYYLATVEDIHGWPTVLPRMQAALNNSTKYSSTSKTPTEILFGFRTREALDLMRVGEHNEVQTALIPEEIRKRTLMAL